MSTEGLPFGLDFENEVTVDHEKRSMTIRPRESYGEDEFGTKLNWFDRVILDAARDYLGKPWLKIFLVTGHPLQIDETWRGGLTFLFKDEDNQLMKLDVPGHLLMAGMTARPRYTYQLAKSIVESLQGLLKDQLKRKESPCEDTAPVEGSGGHSRE